VRRFAPAATGTFAFDGRHDPGKDRPAIALGAYRPGKAFGGSFEAPPGTFRLFVHIVKRSPRGEKLALYGMCERSTGPSSKNA